MNYLKVMGWISGLLLATSVYASDVGQPAQAFEAKTLNNATVSLAFTAGNVVIVNFWATWCEPCRKEMPAFEAYYQKHKNEGLQFLAISMDDAKDEAKAREFMKAFTFPAAMIENTRHKFGRIKHIPLTFVIDKQGILRKDGWFEKDGIGLADLESVVTPLLQAH